MKYVENGGDVRSTSADRVYMGIVFHGSIDDAIAQAKAQPDYGPPFVNGRAELLAFLRVKPEPKRMVRGMNWLSNRIDSEIDRDSLIPPAAPSQPWDGLSPFSLEYAMARWPENFVSAGKRL